MRTLKGARVVITGAASGMGLLYAQRAYAERASSIALWDLDEAGLARAKAKLENNERVSIHRVDLANPDDIDRAYGQTIHALGAAPDVLINNAGIVSGNEYFWKTEYTSQNEPVIRVNVLAPIHITGLFLPSMIADAPRPKRILNVASAAATVSNPRMSVYAASKWAMYGWSDSLRLELVQSGNTHIRVTTFCPSYVSTGMFAGAKGMLLTPVITPNTAVNTAWKAMLAGKPVQFTPWAVNLAKLLKGVLPLRAWDYIAHRMGVYTSMSEFTGRKPT